MLTEYVVVNKCSFAGSGRWGVFESRSSFYVLTYCLRIKDHTIVQLNYIDTIYHEWKVEEKWNHEEVVFVIGSWHNICKKAKNIIWNYSEITKMSEITALMITHVHTSAFCYYYFFISFEKSLVGNGRKCNPASEA